MYKIAIASIACCISLAIHAQNADMRISELVSTSNWFTLEEEYPQLKDTVQFDFVRLMAEAMIAQNFNREKEATDMFQTLINSHQQQIGSGAALYLAEMILRNYEHCGMYGLAAEKADNLIEQIKTSGAPIDYTNLLDIHKKNQITFPAQTSKKPEFGRNLRCSNQFLFVEAEDAKGPLSVLLDSGAETGFTYNYFLKHQNELSKFRGTKEITTGGVDGFHSTMAIYVPTVSFIICNQELKLKDVYVPYMKTKNNYDDIVLGIDFLRKYDNVTLNFKDMFMVIE